MIVEPCTRKQRSFLTEFVKEQVSYFPSIEKKYGKFIAEWQYLVRKRLPAKYIQLVSMLKRDHGMGHGHADAVVAHTLAEKGQPVRLAT